MSSVQDTIRQLIADRGWAVLDNPDVLLGMLEDYGAFRDEDPVSREALRNQIKSGGAKDLLTPKSPTPKVKTKSPTKSKPCRQKGKVGFRKWLSDNGEDICAVVFFICLVLAVISLFATFCCLIYSSPKTAAWAWTLLGSVVSGLVILIMMCIFD